MKKRVTGPALALVIALTGFAMIDGAQARPFIDSAPGHCFLCDYFSGDDSKSGVAEEVNVPNQPEEPGGSAG